MVNNQERFDKKFSKEKKIIDFKYKEFQGQLNIKDYPKLKEIYLLRVKSIDKIALRNLSQLQECTIWDCGINDLVIESCPQIKKLNARNNFLTNLEFLKSLENLEELDLDIGCNNFSESDLEPFGKIVNLSNLNIGNSLTRKALQGKYNRFFDSLEPLENTKKLRELDISNTNISNGLQYLPKSLKKLVCSNDRLISLIKENKCSKIVRELKDYRISGNYYDLSLWRNSQPFYRTSSIMENNNSLVTELNHRESSERKIEDTRVINNITNINIESINNGHNTIGNAIGDSANFGYSRLISNEENGESQNYCEAQVEVLPTENN